jgi:GT2 family glycosyltransferase
VAREFPDVILLRNPANLGFGRANNQAARLSRGRFLFFLNNDTVVPPGALARLVAYAEAHPDIGMIGPRLRDGEGQVQVSYRLLPTVATFLNRLRLVQRTRLLRRAYRRYRRQEFDPSTTRRVEFLMGAAVLMSREVFLACGGWDEGYEFGGEDLDLCYRVGRTHALVYYPEVELRHYGRSSTRQRIGPATSEIERGFVRYLRRTGSHPWAVRLYKLLVCLSAPVELVGRALKYVERHLRGRPGEAYRSLLLMRGLAHFLCKGLVPFWRA